MGDIFLKCSWNYLWDKQQTLFCSDNKNFLLLRITYKSNTHQWNGKLEWDQPNNKIIVRILKIWKETRSQGPGQDQARSRGANKIDFCNESPRIGCLQVWELTQLDWTHLKRGGHGTVLSTNWKLGHLSQKPAAASLLGSNRVVLLRFSPRAFL